MEQKNNINEGENKISNPSITNQTQNNITSVATNKQNNNMSSTSTKKQNSNTSSTNNSEKKKSVKEATFTSNKIPDNILKKMIGNSIPTDSKDKVNINNLSYLKISYLGFDNKTHIGEMIVHKKLAQEVLDIFKEVYEKKYPIEKIRLIDDYGADDEKSMSDNNTSAFCYRVVANTKTLSNHSKGTAIDINPLYNPYVVGNYISPNSGKKYVNRNLKVKGMIKKGDDLYNAFIKRGWTWGGSWSSKKDYQHFEKKV